MVQEYGERVWAGDPAAIAEARDRYQSDPEGYLVPYASALYSFRSNPKYARQLLDLWNELSSYELSYELFEKMPAIVLSNAPTRRTFSQQFSSG